MKTNMRSLLLLSAAALALVVVQESSTQVEALSLPKRRAAVSRGVAPVKIQAAAGSAAVEGTDGEGTATIPNEVL